MNVSCRWVEEFLRRPLDPRDASDRLAMLGAPVDRIEPIHTALQAIVVGWVEAVVPHPNADRLRVCTVRDGGPEPRQVVCGAPNVTPGRAYPFARIGVTLPGGVTIAERKIRGTISQGMLCSGSELGLSDESDGLLDLDTRAEPGTPLLEVLPIGDTRLVVDVTPNRSDLLCHKGIARELAAAYGVPFRLPERPGIEPIDPPRPRRLEGRDGETGGFRVRVEGKSGCSRLLAAVVRGVRVGPSPDWLRARLGAIGLRSINNVVDVTNYVLYELGQPLHAYDAAMLNGNLLVARAAREGERLQTLDGVERTLTAAMIVIGDGAGPIGLAGVMGGRETEVTATTTDLVVECAWFEPARVRASRLAAGLSTDASDRFERGVDGWAAPDALRRALQLLLVVAGGEVVDAPADVWPEVAHPPRIFLRLARVAQVLGVELPLRAVEQALVAIGAAVVAKPADGRLAVDVPGWRPDLVDEIDLIEEIARIQGYDTFPDTLRAFRPGRQADAPDLAAAERVRDEVARLGLYETVTLPLTQGRGVPLANPLSAEHAVLRPDLLSGLVREVERNWAHHLRNVRLAEVGTVFAPAGEPGKPPRERLAVAGVVTGAREPEHWSESLRPRDYDRWAVKWLFERMVGLAYPGARVQVEADRWVARAPGGEDLVGWAGRCDADAPPWAAPLYGFELEILPAGPAPPVFVPWRETPFADRDLALLVPDGVSAAAVIAGLARGGGPELERIEVVDEYRGAGVPDGRRSVAFRCRFRAPDRTLTDHEVDRALTAARQEVERSLGVLLRTT